ncbi:MerR family transcriptional regulator [Paenibacillus sp. GYB004]|uniref:MerR family transcriptional regulator n=1 Tax=Paenibacillus sp. GYB004 TaxID=2994393 RepID=UPI002F96B6D6
MYNIKTVVKLVGIPAVTIRAWENRYGVVEPGRTDGGHRVYSERDVEDLRWLKRQVDERGMNISQAAKLLKQAKAERREGAGREKPVSEADNEPALAPDSRQLTFGKLQALLYDTLIQYRTEEANSLIDMGFALYAYEDMFHHVLVPILYRIGEEWESGKVSVAQEHFTSNMLYQRFHYFFRVLPVQSNMPKAVAFCPSGEHHQLGLLLFVLFLRKKGMEVVYLGTDMPLDGVLHVIESKQIRFVCVSLTGAGNLNAALGMLRHIADKFPDIRFVLGGGAFSGGGHPYSGCVLSGDPAKWESWFKDQVGK